MKKLSTLFKKDPDNLGRVIKEINPENEWVINGYGIPTRKFDGTACAIIDNELYKRYDSKINKKTGKRKPIPEGAIPCQEPDEITGHWPHWVKCNKTDSQDKWHFEGFNSFIKINHDAGFKNIDDGTYELCGEKVQGNPEKIKGHILIPHGLTTYKNLKDLSFESVKNFLSKKDIEGIVFHHKDDKLSGRMCKIRKSDFGIKR